MELKNKKILLVGLGILGGGEATAKFLAENGARLTVTDLGKKENFRKAVNKLKQFKIKFVFGEHRKRDFKENEIIIFNQAVSAFGKWAQLAKKNKKRIETDLTIFLKILKKEKPRTEYIAITGTRGKTTTSVWTHHFLKPAVLGGNIPEFSPFVILKKILKSKSNQPLILEIPSAQLEYFELAKNFKPPKIAVITNLYIDHLNRHGDLKNYALAKARIFSSQKKNDFLILNYDLDNSLFLRRNPKSKIFYVSLKKLPVAKNGLYFAGDKIIFQNEKKRKFAAEIGNFSPHQKYNLLISLLAGRLYGKDWREMTERISSLPSVKFRQEVVFKNKNFVIVNDSAATSPDGAMAAIDNFGRQKNNLILVTGGTDKKLEFGGLSDKIKKRIKKENLFLLNGSATHKLVQELKKIKYFKKESEPNLFENLKDILRKIKKDFSGGVILFSPASASFEKFKNEFDRGKKFNRLVKLIYGK